VRAVQDAAEVRMQLPSDLGLPLHALSRERTLKTHGPQSVTKMCCYVRVHPVQTQGGTLLLPCEAA